MSKFRFVGDADILHLNTRKEGPDEDKVLAVDVKLQATVGPEICDFFEPALADFLFLDSGAVRNVLMGPTTFANELEHYRLEVAGSVHYGVKVKKFALEPKDGRQIGLTFQISFKPSGDEVAKLAEYLQDAIEIMLEPENEELDLGAPTRPAAESTDEPDPLYGQAVQIVRENKRASISLVQRHLSIGYNRAARLLEAMEGAGVISTLNRDGAREVLTA